MRLRLRPARPGPIYPSVSPQIQAPSLSNSHRRIMSHPLRPCMGPPGLTRGATDRTSRRHEREDDMAGPGGKKMSYHRRIMSLLADGEWHSFKEIHLAVARFIDPAAADREYRKRHPHWREDAERVRVTLGKKRLLFLSLNSAIHHRRRVQARGRDWAREYQLMPGLVARRGGEARN